jgi:UDP-N-acetylmuramate dehydrogenase
MADIKDLLSGVKENISLADHTTFQIGGPARYFYIAKTAEDVKKAIEAAEQEKIPYYIIGRGSNILVADNGFKGLVIKIENSGVKIEGLKLIAGAGAMLGKVVDESVKSELSGLEWMRGIPGSIGGAIYGNAGAFGHTIGESVERVEVLDLKDLEQKYLNKENCAFVYRGSIFKEKKYAILSVEFTLAKGDKEASDKLVRSYVLKRQEKHPLGRPNAGSVFKNPSISDNEKAFKKILEKFPEAEKFKKQGKIPAGWLIEEYGLRGKKIGGAIVSEHHGNFIVNAGNAKATDVIMLISLIKQKIRVNFGIQLEEEIQYAGF